ncbi:ATP-binding cassette domain-containing protein [Streptomyces albus subsp. chlorinus]|uniref:ATP-binding cassette domain-containing protein n=1 Tax=Streptomyces albus TaxID=1888 RepID=UPI00156F17B1|nr:ATP-binding cassette domain-containing protein [Streptomyces albus]NSC21644.1 ATP-binding cassette domain-containing protein [Streptomyces albus subsp. chlorinus]
MDPSPRESWAIEAQGLGKAYGSVPVLSGLDLRVRRGSVFALLGPNGAGKTTTVRILATLTRADSGRASVAGHDVATERSRVRRTLSLTGQYAALDEEQSGRENLRMMARLRGHSRAGARRRTDELLARFALTEAADRRVGTYSGGMRRRLDIAAGLVGDPEVVFLDEPTTGLDPRSRRTMWQAVQELARAGVTVFLTTQYLEEADQLADQVAVLDKGRIVAQGTPEELKKTVAAQRLDLTLTHRGAYEEMAARLTGRVLHREPEDLLLGVATDGSAAHVRALLDELDPARTEVARFALHSATLDDVFLELTHE